MSEFCPSCSANVGFGTVEIIGCPLCGYKPDDYDDEEIDDDELPTDEEIERMERQQRAWERAERTAQGVTKRRRRKAGAAKAKSGSSKRCRRVPSPRNPLRHA